MMKPILSALTVAAGLMLGNSASAQLRLSDDGVGHAVYVPLYSVDDGFSSLLTVGNDSDQPSMVRVLVSESENGQAVIFFNVYLPAHAVWSGAISSTTNGGARVTSDSAVCTVPNMTSSGFQLLWFDYANNFPDGGSTAIGRVRNGAVEVIELASLSGDLANDTTTRNCAALQAEYTAVGGVVPDHSDQIEPPTGRVSANMYLVAVADGLIQPVPGIAIEGFADVGRDPDFESAPRLANPVLANGATVFSTDSAVGRLEFAADRGPDAISSLFMRSSLIGEFYANPGLGATTEWAVSFPTKAAYVDDRPGSLASGGVAEAPFSSFYGADGSCDTIATSEGLLDGTPLETTVPTSIDLCAQVNWIAFEQPFADAGQRRLLLAAEEGRSVAARRPDGTAVELRGLPAVGLQLSNFVNGQLQGGVLANYSIGQSLRSTPATVVELTEE